MDVGELLAISITDGEGPQIMSRKGPRMALRPSSKALSFYAHSATSIKYTKMHPHITENMKLFAVLNKTWKDFYDFVSEIVWLQGIRSASDCL